MTIPGGPAAEREHAPWARHEKIALAVLVVGCLLSLPLTIHPWYDSTPDGSIYLVTARSLLDGLGHTFFGEPFHLRPPGFSVLLLPFLRADGTSFAAIHWMVSLFGVGAVAAAFAYQRTRIGWLPAALVAAAIWVTPVFQRLCNQVMSDVPGVALLLAALLVERWTHRRPSVGREVLLGVCVGAFAYVRTVVILLLPAIVVSRLLERVLAGSSGPPWLPFLVRRVVLVVAAAVVVQLPWSLTHRPGESAPAADQTARFSYSTGMWHEDEGDPASPRLSFGEVAGSRFRKRVGDMTGALGSNLRTDDTDAGRTAVAAALVLSALWVLFKRRAPADFFIFGAMTVFSIYFGFKPRLVLPVWILALPALFETFGDLVRRVGGPGSARRFVPVAIVAWAALHFAPRHEWDAIRERHQAFRARCDELAARLPDDARVGTEVGWHYAAYLERPVFSLRFHIRRVDDPGRGIEEMVDKYGLNTVVVEPDRPSERGTWKYLLHRYGDHTEDGGFEWAGPLAIVRVRP